MLKLFIRTFLSAFAALFIMTHAFAENIQVEIAGFAFNPDTISLNAGDTITFTNKDNAPHTATANDGSFTTKRLAPGESETITITSSGTFPFFCKIHPSMKGKIIAK